MLLQQQHRRRKEDVCFIFWSLSRVKVSATISPSGELRFLSEPALSDTEPELTGPKWVTQGDQHALDVSNETCRHGRVSLPQSSTEKESEEARTPPAVISGHVFRRGGSGVDRQQTETPAAPKETWAD